MAAAWRHQKWQQELDTILSDEAGPQGILAPPGRKTIYIVRHAESRSNVAKAKLKSGELIHAAEGAVDLACVGFDAPLSVVGRQQLLSVRPKAREISGELEAVLFSPLQRARETALVLFGDSDGRAGFQPPAGKFWRSVRALKEKRPKEYAQKFLTFSSSQSIMQSRVRGVMKFLEALPWKSFALVGHSHFFRSLLKHMGVTVYLCNANIWRAELAVGTAGLMCGPFQLVAFPQGSEGIPCHEEEPEPEDASLPQLSKIALKLNSLGRSWSSPS